MSFSSSNTAVAVVSDTTLILVKAGTVTITASQPGRGFWAAAIPVSRELIVGKAGQVIAFELVDSIKKEVGTLVLSATATSGLPVVFGSSDETIASVTGSTLTLLKLGTVTITASQPGNDGWDAAAAVAHELVIVKRSQNITFELTSPVKLSAGTLPLSATATSGLPVVFSSSDETVASVMGGTLTLLKSGTVTITASQPGDADWLAASPVVRALVIEQNDQTITFNLTSPVKLSAETLALSATATSGLPVVFSSSDETVASVMGGTLTLLKSGTVTITASQPGDADWLAASPVVRALVIEQNDQTITFNLTSPVKLSAGTLALSATATSGLPVVFSSSDETVASVMGGTLTLLKSGTVTITASQPGDADWLAASPVVRALVIEQNDQTITFNLTSPVKLSAGTLALSATATSGLPVVFSSSDETIASVMGSTLILLKSGTVTITASQIGDANWSAATPVSRELVIEGNNDQTITFNLTSPVKLSAGTLPLSATATSGLPVVFVSSDETIASVMGSTLMLLKSGTVTITASQIGDANWSAATPVSRELVIEGNNDQTITFHLSSPVKSGVGTLTLSATATSGLPVAFSSNDESIASVSGNTLMLHAAGTVVIKASQTGDAIWNKAPEQLQTLVVEQSFVIIAPDPENGKVNIRDIGGKEYVAGTVIPDGTQVTVSVVTAPEWVFVGWSDGNSDHPRILTFPIDADLNANFKHLQKIDFDLVQYITLGETEAVDLNAVAESGLVVEYESSNPAIAEIRSGQLIPLTLGQITVTARQSGDNEWMPAEEVVRTVVILPGVPDMDVVNVVEVRGDNNTKFLIKNFELYSVVKLKLMNIQGKVVYRSDHYDNSLEMRDFSRGAYYYVIEATQINGRQEVLKGGMEVIK